MKTKPCLTAADVKTMLSAAEAAAAARNQRLAIAILDDGGHPMGVLRMDGSTVTNLDMALAKARTSALSGRPSKFWADRLNDGRLLMLSMPVMPAQGGLPILVMGECLGAIATSGGSGDEEERAAQAGLDALGT
jgi:glc operon protein GlcG